MVPGCQPAGVKLSSIVLERAWPVLPAPVLALSELEQDEVYPLLDKRKIGTYLNRSLSIGREAARDMKFDGDLKTLLNRMLRSGVRIRFREGSGPGGTGWVRAQYRIRPPTITVFRSSVEQLNRFFRMTGNPVRREDLIALHLIHEWFHHLEVSHIGRTDLRLPQVVTTRLGPFPVRRPLKKTREIAAHAFVQEMMGLSFYPLLLDRLLLHLDRGLSKEQIREQFEKLRTRYRSQLPDGT
ncbi:hypothetical protein SAMN04488025_107105 [Planifilum fulgidum]|uniref:Uncharacterized protein n=1 Tax=Planifilum fulgidum TaxID=201973 RepID=A0A1I2MA27_9BACL|nr:hypothetical protein [Planifilum fulgidum]SFF88345.1 hypothetical protein SAMN04488025_107105 [Planifilum fulgidum]